MATIYGAIKGIVLLSENVQGTVGNVALVSFEMPAYVSGSDNGQLGGGGYDRGTATTASLVSMITTQRRDGKTIALLPVAAGGGAILETTGLQGSTQFYAGTWAVSGENLTFNLTNAAGTEISAASGVVDRAVCVLVSYTAT